MSRYLVTGGAGFIGSNIVASLLEKGHYVRVLDNFFSGKEENLAPFAGKIDLIRGDICSVSDCLQATKDIDFVLHEAALRSVPKSLLEPHEYNRVNIDGTLNVLEACVTNKVKKFVLASSSSVYGDTKDFPEKEDFLPAPISPYALSKLTCEHYCKMFSMFHGLACVALRYFNVFGPRQALDDEYAVVIPKFINCIMSGQQPPIFGTGKQSRDFTFVQNVVQANLLAAAAKLDYGVFNVAAGRSVTVLELVKLLNNILGTDVAPKLLPVRAGDVFKTEADISHARRLLNFKPEVDFIDGLKITVDYWKKKNA